MFYFRTVSEIVDKAMINTKERIRNAPKKIPKKYKYKEKLKSRRGRK